MPEIVQYFVTGEFQPPTTTYVVPIGEPPLNQGSSTNDAYHAPPSSHGDHRDDGQPQDQAQRSQFSHAAAVEGMKTETGEEQVPGAPSGAPTLHHEERTHKPEPPPMEYSWDAQR